MRIVYMYVRFVCLLGSGGGGVKNEFLLLVLVSLYSCTSPRSSKCMTMAVLRRTRNIMAM